MRGLAQVFLLGMLLVGVGRAFRSVDLSKFGGYVMSRFVLGVACLALVLAVPAGASRSAARARGVVVGSERGVLLVASSRGLVQQVSGRAAVGTRVLVGGAQLLRVFGRTDRAVIRGVVVRRSGGLMFLSAAGRLLVVHLGARRLAASDAGAAPGAVVQSTVGITGQGELDDHGDQQLGQTGQVQVQATVTGVGAGTVTLNVNGQTLTIPLPAGLSLPTSLVNTQVTLNFSFANGQTTASEQGDNNNQSDDSEGQGEQDHKTTTATTSGTTTTTTSTTTDDEGGGGHGGGGGD